MECGKIDIGDCGECCWLAYDPVKDKEVCVSNDDRPIGEVEVCNIDELMYKAEDSNITIELERELILGKPVYDYYRINRIIKTPDLGGTNE